MRGEYLPLRPLLLTVTGSPTHVWGILVIRAKKSFLTRVTHTRVGNTNSALDRHPFDQGHPHTCGEYQKEVIACYNSSGSPPHVWGILDSGVLDKLRLVGHPHTCGEYDKALQTAVYDAGSPPHVWGIHSKIQLIMRTLGVTPTRVGNTAHKRSLCLSHQGHPHTCGEYADDGLPQQVMEGSPPHVWGIH